MPFVAQSPSALPSCAPGAARLSRLLAGAVGALVCTASPLAIAQSPSTAVINPLPGGSLTSRFAALPTNAINLREGVAAVVNDEIISTYDLRQRTLLLVVTSGVQPTAENLPGIQQEALRDLVDERLQMQEIAAIERKQKVKVEPTDKEIDQQISEVAQQNNMTGAQLVGMLSSAGVEAQTLRDQIRVDVSWRRYVSGRFGSSISVGADQINSALQRTAAAAAKPQYLVAEIFIDAQRVGGQAVAVQGAQQLVSQLQQGAPFAAVARQFSAAPTAANGGDAGWLVAGDIAPAVEAVLSEMRPGQLSQPIPVTGGAYVVLLRDKRSGAGATLVSLKQAAIRLAADASPADVDAARTRLEALRAQINGCETLEAQAGKADGVIAGDLGETEVKDLSPEFQSALAPLKVGQISAPVRTTAGLHLVALCGRRSSSGTEPSRTDIENRLFEQEMAMIARRELRNLRNSASIENR